MQYASDMLCGMYYVVTPLHDVQECLKIPKSGRLAGLSHSACTHVKFRCAQGRNGRSGGVDQAWLNIYTCCKLFYKGVRISLLSGS